MNNNNIFFIYKFIKLKKIYKNNNDIVDLCGTTNIGMRNFVNIAN